MSGSAHLPFDALNAALKAAGEETRLRILVLLGEAELTVSDLTADPAAVAAAHLAPSQASGRGRADRALPRGRLGVLPPRRGRRRGRVRPRTGRAARSEGLDDRPRPRPARGGAHRARGGGAGLFPRPRRAMGPHPQASCHRRGGRGRDPRCARRPAVPLAARPRHRHRPHPGNVRADLERGLGIDLSLDMLLLARARIERAGLRHCSVRQGDIYDLAVPADFVRRRHHPSGAALPRRRRARDPRGGARAGAWRPAAGGRLRAARSGIPARGARAPAARLSRRSRDAMDERGRPRRHHAPQPFA